MEIYNTLFNILQQDDLLLTPNQGLIYFLRKSHATYQRTQHKHAWPSLHVFKLETWLRLQWETQLVHTHEFAYRLLTPHQEQVVWQSVIRQCDSNFLVVDELAKTVQQAWQINLLWQLNGNDTHLKHSKETTALKIWAECFVAVCKKNACIDLPRAMQLLIDCFKRKILVPPARIFFIGFDEINPLTQTLLHVLKQLGSQITYFTAASPQPYVRRVALLDTETELHTMARWAHQQWKTNKETIICVVPQLLKLRTAVLETFTEIFTQTEPSHLPQLPFNIAAGKKMNAFPVIQSALTIIQTQAIHSLLKLNTLLLSPYIGYAEDEKYRRAQLSIYLRCYTENHLSLKTLALLSQQQHCVYLSQFISALIPLTEGQPLKKLPSQWAKHFIKKLQALGWPGHSLTEGEDLAVIERWSELLDEFSILDFILDKIDEEFALEQLFQLINESLFKAKTPHDKPIHIIGLLDTAGLCVDNLWVMGLDNKSWPPSAYPNPFIPYKIQRDHATPHACNERELYFSSLLTQRLLKSSHTLILSHALHDKTQQSLQASQLIQHIPCIETKDLALSHYENNVETIWRTQHWEYYSDERAPALSKPESNMVNSQLFKSQSACPFQAFAKFRLKTHFHDSPSLGLSKSDRGRLLHRAIELFWNNFTDQASLLKQSAQTLHTLTEQAIDTAITEFSSKRPLTFSPRFKAMEHERLQQRLKKLIERDKNRPPFTNVKHEQKQSFNLANLVLTLRIDRIDRQKDGDLWIMDYKTGESKPALGWLEERLEEPQLPLYCLSLPHVKGCSVIRMGSHTIEAQGYYHNNETGLCHAFTEKKDKNLGRPWSEVLNFWKQALEKLAYQFQIGAAKVDPKTRNVCKYCHLQLFCRINHHEKSN